MLVDGGATTHTPTISRRTGHLGIAKTIARIAEHYYWPSMFREIARYVRNCQACTAYKAAQMRTPGLLHPTATQRPWQHVSVDLVGPLPRSTQGHTWLLTIQDRFTKWLEICAIRQATTSTITKHLTEAIILRHGCPEEILTDNGTQFKSAKFTKDLRDLGILHKFTPSYTLQCNPVERTNRTVKTMIAQYIGKRHRTWDANLTTLQFAYNTARHDATGFTPAYLNHGRELRRPEELPNPLRRQPTYDDD